MSDIKIMSWDINGIHTKLENEGVRLLVRQYDIICFNEVKTGLTVELPGYVTYHNAVVRLTERGFTAVCVKTI